MKEYKCANCGCTDEENLYYCNDTLLCRGCFVDSFINTRKDIVSDFLSDNIEEFCNYTDYYLI